MDLTKCIIKQEESYKEILEDFIHILITEKDKSYYKHLPKIQ